MMGSYGNTMGSLGWLGMGVFWLLLLGLIVWLVMRLLPGSTAERPTPPAIPQRRSSTAGWPRAR